MDIKPTREEVDKAYQTIVADLRRKGWNKLTLTLQKNGDLDYYLAFTDPVRSTANG